MPAVLDDSLSYYECLCKISAKLNDAIETINRHSELITTMQSEIDALQTLTAQHTQQIADLTKKVQANADNITAINTRTKGLSTKTDSANNWFGLNLQTDDSYVYRLAWSTDAPAASVLQTSRPGSVYYQIGGPQDDWTWAHVQNSTKGTQPAFTSISRTVYNQITSDINDVESSAAQNAQAIKALQDLTSDHSTAISNLQDSVGKNTQAITNLNKGLSSTNATVAKIESSLETLNTRTKGFSTVNDTVSGWFGFNLLVGSDNYRIGWSRSAPIEAVTKTSAPGSLYLTQTGLTGNTYGYSQTGTQKVKTLYNGSDTSPIENELKTLQTTVNGHTQQISTLMDDVNNNVSDISDLQTNLTSATRTITQVGNLANEINTRTKGFSTVNDTVSGWFGFNLLVGSDNYRIGWSRSAPIEAVTKTSAPGSLYLTQTGLTGNTYGYSQTGTQKVKTLYNGSDTSPIENELKTLQTTVNGHTQQISTLMDDVNNNVSDISDLQTNLTSATHTITQVGNLANEINTRTKGISTKTDNSDNWTGISLSTDDSHIYRVAWTNETPALPVLQQSSPGSLYLRTGGPAPDIWLYACDQNGTDIAMPLVTEKI